MQWIQYIMFALLLWFIVTRILPVKGVQNLDASLLKEKLRSKEEHLFIDVREVYEFKSGHIPGFMNIPLSQLKNRLHEIDRNKSVILTCRSGARSSQAAKILKGNGFQKLSHLKNGISAWHGDVER